MITVVLADDHRIFVQGLCALLSNTGDISVIGTADNGAGALQKIQQRKPDIAVLDISMPAPECFRDCGNDKCLYFMHS